MNNLLPLRGEGFPPINHMKVCRALLFAVLAAFVCVGPVARAADDATKTAGTDSKSTDKKADAKGVSDTVNPGSAYQPNNYVLRPTDVIGVNVVDDPRASSDYTISSDGTVGLTYLDPDKPLKVEGLTVAEAVKAIIHAYVEQKIFIKPTINITVKNYAERRINVVGAVGSPGWVIIPPQQNLSLVSAITQAHGPTPRAAATVNITRIMPDGSTKVFKDVDLYKAYKGSGPDFPLQEGDTIFLGESAFANVWQ